MRRRQPIRTDRNTAAMLMRRLFRRSDARRGWVDAVTRIEQIIDLLRKLIAQEKSEREISNLAATERQRSGSFYCSQMPVLKSGWYM